MGRTILNVLFASGQADDLRFARLRQATYWCVGLGLAGSYALLRGVEWQSNIHIHTAMELLAAPLAFTIGVITLIRFHTKKNDNKCLFIGAGFIGAAFLDGYHAVVTSEFFAAYLPSDLSSLVPWSWFGARQILAVLLFLSVAAWFYEKKVVRTKRFRERTLYLAVAALTLASFLFFALAPLPRAYYPEYFFHRPQEFLPAFFFLMALGGYLWKGAWRHNAFEHWLVLALVIGFAGEALFMASSSRLFDWAFDAAHLLKMASYLCVLIGTLISTHAIFWKAEERKTHLRTMVNSVFDAVIMIDERGAIRSFNRAAERIFGYDEKDVVGQNVRMLMPEPSRSNHDGFIRNYIRTGEAKIIGIGREVVGLRRDGIEFPMDLAVTEMRLDGRRTFIGLCRDITARRQAEDRVKTAYKKLERAQELALYRAERSEARYENLTQYDALTGLANRSQFHISLADKIANAKRTGRSLSVLLLDLDRFNEINDTLGHATGDGLLKLVAERLKANARETDLIARLGGDEFAVVVTNQSHIESIGTIAQKIIDLFHAPFEPDGHLVHTSTSIGISSFSGDEATSEQLFKHADIALYQAKAEGPGNWHHYDKRLDELIRNRKCKELELRQAIAQNEFEIYYQPQIDLETRALIGAECLIRWNHPAHGLVMPGDFLQVAELSGLIVPIGELVIRAACEQSVAWQKKGLPPIRLSINVSLTQLRRGDLEKAVSKILDETGADSKFLEFEVTEEVASENNLARIAKILWALKEKGIQIAIDDFGTGYSSLSHLKNFPVDILKIDRSFVSDMCGNLQDIAIVRTIVQLGHSLGLRVIAEGVETEGQIAALRREGCEQAQGFYFGRPIPASAFAEMLKERLALRDTA